MNVAGIARKIGQFATRNSAAICSGFAVAGVLTTGYFAWKAGRQSAWFADEEKPWQDELKATWRLYIPAAVAAVTTVGFIIGAQHISNRKNAALAAAYSLVETGFAEYKNKVVETIGEKAEDGIREAVVKERVEQNPPNGSVLLLGNSEVTCYETFTGRYFKSNPELIKQAQNNFNERILNSFGYASANEFWEEIGLEWTQAGDELGWNTDVMLKTQFTSVLDPNSKPCLAIGYSDVPVPKYHYHG